MGGIYILESVIKGWLQTLVPFRTPRSWCLPRFSLRIETDPVSEMWCWLDYQKMDKVQTLSNPKCYIPSPEPFRAHRYIAEPFRAHRYIAVLIFYQDSFWFGNVSVQTFYIFVLASYPMGNKGSFPGCKAAGTWSWLVPRSRNRGSIHPLPRTLSWHCA
jgi:hypothetical protein